MGFAPSEVDCMSVWQFMAAADGYRKAHDPDAGNGLSGSEADALWAMVQKKMDRT